MYRKHPFYFAPLSARSPDFFSYKQCIIQPLLKYRLHNMAAAICSMNSFYRTAAALTSMTLTACGCTLLLIMRTTRISPGTLPPSSFISFLWTAEPVFLSAKRFPCMSEIYGLEFFPFQDVFTAAGLKCPVQRSGIGQSSSLYAVILHAALVLLLLFLAGMPVQIFSGILLP